MIPGVTRLMRAMQASARGEAVVQHDTRGLKAFAPCNWGPKDVSHPTARCLEGDDGERVLAAARRLGGMATTDDLAGLTGLPYERASRAVRLCPGVVRSGGSSTSDEPAVWVFPEIARPRNSFEAAMPRRARA